MKTETYEIRGQKFEWDRSKNISNIEKHGITFKIAAEIFFDPRAKVYDDKAHSQDEQRFILIGMNEKDKVLTVCHCYRGEDESITRIISARKATKHEEILYGGIE
ncbi:MAG: BrnT family toxin [Oscillospiraceae bacterium]|nr:BrnT family toxin [Oscillospiraceae bacterium]